MGKKQVVLKILIMAHRCQICIKKIIKLFKFRINLFYYHPVLIELGNKSCSCLFALLLNK